MVRFSYQISSRHHLESVILQLVKHWLMPTTAKPLEVDVSSMARLEL